MSTLPLPFFFPLFVLELTVAMPLQSSKTTCEEPSPLQLDFVRVGSRYRVGKLLGSGGSGEPNSESLTEVWHFSDTSLGSVYLGRDIRTGGDVALKIGYTGETGLLSSGISHEYNVYTRIAGCTGTSPVLWYGKEGLYEVIVLEYLGNSLGDLINEQKFDSGETFLCASQMVCSYYLFKKAVLLTALVHVQLSAVESLHARHFIHRDIKPSNFMAQADGVSPTISLIDFGLARLFRNPLTYLHIPYTMGHSAVGTLLFTSVNGQQGYAQSRHDDLESLAYTIIYLVRGDLPWTHLSAHRDHKAVLCKKTQITVEELCEGLPTPFCEFIIHVRSLGFDQKPDYQRLHSILTQCSGTGIDQPSKAPLFSAPPPVGVNCTSFPSDPV